jgi:hypothetical protein
MECVQVKDEIEEENKYLDFSISSHPPLPDNEGNTLFEVSLNVFFFLSNSHHMKNAYLTLSEESVIIFKVEGVVFFGGGGGEHLTFGIHKKYFGLEQKSLMLRSTRSFSQQFSSLFYFISNGEVFTVSVLEYFWWLEAHY